MLSSCAGVYFLGFGLVRVNAKVPLMVSENKMGKKVGTGQYWSLLGLVAMGDAGIQDIAKNAGIKEVSHVDYEVKSVLSLYARATIYVYGN
ncbi:MAG TPA: hypothetical protein DCX54_01890 [Flavobacteriales bacterium]|nr:hypothetical protein [Flavobacteriales bacterium]